ncbi:hypothetical protein [Sphingobacterium suaedae]|uniref:DoxX family membrane protein n=1 Tax=Sphingobacterium suaedae TaxID=1686402 RepID=A0ABW5KP41_9SPHI
METQTFNPTFKSIYNVLRLTYGIVPIVAGLDKFTNILTQWDQYLHPGIAGMLPFSASVFMMIVGVIEILAGILVLVKPSFGAPVVSIWLTLIASTLLFRGHFLDVAVRDLVMAVGALSLSKMAVYYK